MKPITIEKFAEVINAEIIGQVKGQIDGITIDSRTVKPGDAFFAIKGENYDGHNFAAQASKTATCVVVDKDIKIDSAVIILKTKNTIAALGQAAKYIREISDYKVIAITGSAGKTTTRNMIHHVLNGYFKCHQAEKSFNNNIGLPLTLLKAPEDSEIVIAEIGTNNPGEIEPLAKIAAPDIGLITNVFGVHLAGFGNIEAIKKEKAAISKGINPGGKLIINSQTEGIINHCQTDNIEIITFGQDSDCDVFAEDVKISTTHSQFRIDGIDVHLPLIGKGNLENAIAAWAVCKSMGITAVQFAERIKTAIAMKMRTEVINIGKAVLINDCYNANPASMENAIEILAAIAKEKKARPVFICGPMAELGDDSINYHRLLGEKVAEKQIPLLLTIEGDSAETAKAAQKGANGKISAEVFGNTETLCHNLEKFVRADDIVLVKASRNARFETVSEKLKYILNRTH